nr:unnamed protein product [Digitaria exilis]
MKEEHPGGKCKVARLPGGAVLDAVGTVGDELKKLSMQRLLALLADLSSQLLPTTARRDRPVLTSEQQQIERYPTRSHHQVALRPAPAEYVPPPITNTWESDVIFTRFWGQENRGSHRVWEQLASPQWEPDYVERPNAVKIRAARPWRGEARTRTLSFVHGDSVQSNGELVRANPSPPDGRRWIGAVLIGRGKRRPAPTPFTGQPPPPALQNSPTPATLLSSRLATARPPIDQARPAERPPPRAADRARKRSDQEARLARGRIGAARGASRLASSPPAGRPAS